MSIAYEIDKQTGITYEVWDGKVTNDEYIANIQKMAADPDWPSARHVNIVDIRTREQDSLIDKGTINRVADFMRRKLDNIGDLQIFMIIYDEYMSSSNFVHVSTLDAMKISIVNNLSIVCGLLDIDEEKAENRLENLRAGIRNETNGNKA